MKHLLSHILIFYFLFSIFFNEIEGKYKKKKWSLLNENGEGPDDIMVDSKSIKYANKMQKSLVQTVMSTNEKLKRIEKSRSKLRLGCIILGISLFFLLLKDGVVMYLWLRNFNSNKK